MVRPWWMDPESRTSIVCTSKPGSRICTDAMTGFGTASRSDRPPSGDEMASGATMIPPASLRMSWRIRTVLSSGPRFMEEWLRPM